MSAPRNARSLMSALRNVTRVRSRRSKSPLRLKRHKRRGKHGLGDAKLLVGRDLANDTPHRRIPLWLIPGFVVGAVFAALAIVQVRVGLIDQG